MGWTEFALAFAAFFLTLRAARPPAAAALAGGASGPRGFGLAYSALSLAVLSWLIGVASARALRAALALVAMATPCAAGRHAARLPDPRAGDRPTGSLSFGGARNEAFDPARPGVVRLTRHPLLLALAIWATAHVVPNGDLAHVLLFGTFAVFALAGRAPRRPAEAARDGRGLDASRCSAQAAPLPPPPRSWPAFGLRLALGAALYFGLLWLHPWLFGVSPLP